MVEESRTSPELQSAGNWQEAMIARVRHLISEADPEAVEERKWRKPSKPEGVPTWSHAGLICTAESYKDKVKLTFARGAALEDPSELFNSSLAGGTRRAIDLEKGASLDEGAFKKLVAEAARVNLASKSQGS